MLRRGRPLHHDHPCEQAKNILPHGWLGCYRRCMDDQIIDAAMVRALHADACRQHPIVAQVVMHDPPDHPGRFTARLMTRAQQPYVLVGDGLAELQEQLPPGLVRSERMPADPL